MQIKPLQNEAFLVKASGMRPTGTRVQNWMNFPGRHSSGGGELFSTFWCRRRAGGGVNREGELFKKGVDRGNMEEPTLELCGLKRLDLCRHHVQHHYRKRGSASYIVREVRSVREREREREIQREREGEKERYRRKWRHHCRAKIGDEFTLSHAKNSHNCCEFTLSLAKNSHFSFFPSHFLSQLLS